MRLGDDVAVFFIILMQMDGWVRGLHYHNNESLIVAKIFKNYDRSLLPSLPGANVGVNFGMSLTQIVAVEEIKDNVVINAWIRQEWHDFQLAWNESEFGGVKTINLSAKKIWLPDIRLFSNVDPDKSYNGFLDTSLTMVQLKSSGKVKWNIPIIFRTYCRINVADFPFDSQSCLFKFGSWTYDVSNVDVTLESDTANLSPYANNEQWLLQSMKATREELKFVCCEQPFSIVTYTLNIKRKPLFCVMNLIMPSALFSTLSLIVYMIPSEAAERASFAVNWLLAMAFFMTNAIAILPDSSESIPIYSRFQGLALVNMFLLIVTLCYTLSLHYADARVAIMPRWVRVYILGKLSHILRVRVAKVRAETPDQFELVDLFSKPLNQELSPSHPGRLWRIENFKSSCLQFRLEQSLLNDDDLCACISTVLTGIIAKIKKKEELAIRKTEWRIVARTLDTLCAAVFTLFLVIITLYCAM